MKTLKLSAIFIMLSILTMSMGFPTVIVEKNEAGKVKEQEIGKKKYSTLNNRLAGIFKETSTLIKDSILVWIEHTLNKVTSFFFKEKNATFACEKEMPAYSECITIPTKGHVSKSALFMAYQNKFYFPI